MGFLFSNFLPKIDSGVHGLFFSRSDDTTSRRDINSGRQPGVTGIISAFFVPEKGEAVRKKQQPVKKTEFSVVRCRIIDNAAKFEESEFKAIQQRIEAFYSDDIAWILQNIRSYDKTIIVDLLLDNTGIVIDNHFLHPKEPDDIHFYKKIQNRILKWVFPDIVHQGRCRLAFSEKSRV